MVPGLELVAGYLFAWAVRKVRRVGTQADSEVDRVLDAGMERLHNVVAARLGSDPALAQLEREAADEVDSERTRRRVNDAVEQAVEDDPGFAAQLREVLDALAEASGKGHGGMQARDTGSVVQTNVDGVAVANTGVVGGSVNAGGSGT